MDNQVEEIKHKLDIVNVISKYLPLKKRGRHFLANCPFHGEKTPSFMVSPELQIFKCFGCGKAGDIYTFIQEYEKIDFREALEEMAKLAGVTLTQSAQLSQSESHKKKLIEINNEVAKFYHYVLTSHPLGKQALDYVLNRGISMETIKLFKIGYSPSRNDSLVHQLQKKAFAPKDLISTGTFGQSNYGNRLYDRFQGRLIFPLFDYRDRILGFSGRILPFTENQNSAKYINSPETEIYHKGFMVYGLNLAKEFIKKEDSVLVVEGEFDMISPYQLGVKNIVALKGTAFTQEQLQLLSRYTQNLVLALDSDFAGNNAAKKSIELAENLGMEIKVLTLGKDFKDPDEAVKDDPDYFKDRLNHLVPIWDYLIQSSVANYGTDTIAGKKNIMSMVLPFLAKIENAVIRSDYLRELAAQLGTTEDALKQEAARYQSGAVPTPQIDQTSRLSESLKQWSQSNSATQKLEESVLTLLFGTRDPLAVFSKLKDQLNQITLPMYQSILEVLSSQSEFDPKTFADLLPPELQTIFQNIYLNAISLDITSERRAQELHKKLIQMEESHLKSQLKELSQKIAQNEENQSIDSLEKEYNLVLQKLSKLQHLQK